MATPHRNYRIISANKAYCDQEHCSSQEIIGNYCYRCSHNRDKPCYEFGEECAPRQTFETGAVHMVEKEALDPRQVKSIPPAGGKENILLAEDEPSLRKLMKIVLESYGYSVIAAEDGEDAILKFMENKDRIQLIILDLIMPKKSGKDAYEAIRKTSPDIKTLFVSRFTADIIKREEIVKEELDFINKPILPKDLLSKVREVLDK